MGAVGLVARVGDHDVSMTVRCIEARHNTPQMYSYWTETIGHHHPFGGGKHDVTRSAARGLTGEEIKQIRNALAEALAKRQALLTAV